MLAANDIRYTAVSHVWADGLGNKDRNALRHCQIDYIYSQFANLPETYETESDNHFVWIDTMCCPATAAEEKAMALTRMRETFANAENVLVLDAELEMTDVKHLGEIEIMTRVVNSTWAHRLWTLQETFFANQFLVKFHDRILDLDLVASKGLKMPATFKNLSIFMNTLTSLAAIRKNPKFYSTLKNSEMPVFAYTPCGRSVSVPSGEAICLSSILCLPTEELVRTSAAEKMQYFWTLHPKLQQTSHGESSLASGQGLLPRGSVGLHLPSYHWIMKTF